MVRIFRSCCGCSDPREALELVLQAADLISNAKDGEIRATASEEWLEELRNAATYLRGPSVVLRYNENMHHDGGHADGFDDTYYPKE